MHEEIEATAPESLHWKSSRPRRRPSRNRKVRKSKLSTSRWPRTSHRRRPTMMPARSTRSGTGCRGPRFIGAAARNTDLILDMKGCRLERLNNGGPVLDSHSAYGVSSQLGVVRKAWAKKSTGLATIQFSKREAVTPLWNDVKSGIIQNLSPGMWIYNKVDTTPKGQERREFTAMDWEPFEISLVAVPADAATNFMSAAQAPPARQIRL